MQNPRMKICFVIFTVHNKRDQSRASGQNTRIQNSGSLSQIKYSYQGKMSSEKCRSDCCVALLSSVNFYYILNTGWGMTFLNLRRDTMQRL